MLYLCDRISYYMNQYSCSGSYNDEVHRLVSKCNQHDVDYFFRFIGMDSTIQLCTNEYVCGIKTVKIPNKLNLSLIFKSKTDYKIYFYDFESFENILKIKSPVIIRPIYCDLNGEKHILLLIVDKGKRTISIIDVNCVTTYSKLFDSNIKNIIDKIWERHGVKYTHKVHAYGKQSCNCFNDSGQGMCVPVSLFISHYIVLSGDCSVNIMKKISAIDRDSLYNFIISHTLFYYLCIVDR